MTVQLLWLHSRLVLSKLTRMPHRLWKGHRSWCNCLDIQQACRSFADAGWQSDTSEASQAQRAWCSQETCHHNTTSQWRGLARPMTSVLCAFAMWLACQSFCVSARCLSGLSHCLVSRLLRCTSQYQQGLILIPCQTRSLRSRVATSCAIKRSLLAAWIAWTQDGVEPQCWVVWTRKRSFRPICCLSSPKDASWVVCHQCFCSVLLWWEPFLVSHWCSRRFARALCLPRCTRLI